MNFILYGEILSLLGCSDGLFEEKSYSSHYEWLHSEKYRVPLHIIGSFWGVCLGKLYVCNMIEKQYYVLII
jgi:hypothetical protein